MRVVDHDARRREIAEVAMALIADEGLEATTLNRIAQELGASIRVITHYFADKDELLFWVYQAMAQRGQAHIQAVIERDPGDLVGVLSAMCGSDDAMLKQWRIYIAFWEKAARSPRFAAEQQQWIQRTLEIIEAVVLAKTGAAADEQCARELTAFVYGISAQRALDPSSWTPENTLRTIERLVSGVKRFGPT